MTALLLPSVTVGIVLLGLLRRVNVYEAFVCGAREGLGTLVSFAPYLCAVLSMTALLRESGAMDALTGVLSPCFALFGLPREIAGVVLLRPFSGSAALAAVADVMRECGADSRAGLLACVISSAGETVFFTSSLYLGAAGIKKTRYAIPAALAAYTAGVLSAGLICR